MDEKKPVKRRSKIWNYFTPLDAEHARCELCRKRVSYKSSISNLKRHKIRKHSTISTLPTDNSFEFLAPQISPETDAPQILYIEQTESKPSTNSTKLNERKRSKIWNYFIPVSSYIALCKLCQQTVSYKSSTSNLKRHKLRKHANVNYNDGESSTNTLYSGENCTKPNISDNNIITISPTQVTQERPISVKNATKKKIDDCLIQLFTVDFQPFSLVDDLGFRNLVKTLNSGYELPSRKAIVKTYIPNLYEHCLSNMKQTVAEIKAACLTIDSWTSITGDNYMAVTVHFIDHDYKLNTILLECIEFFETYTSENLATELQMVVEKWDLNNKILTCVSDYSPSIKDAVSRLGWIHLGCFAHSLNLIVQDALKVSDDLLKKIRTIAGHFRRNHYAKNQLEAFQDDSATAQKKIVTDISTRWNSTLHMLESFNELDAALQATMSLIEDAELPVLETVDWKSIKQLCKMLKPFEEATQQVSGEKYLPASLVIPITIGLHRVCEKMQESSDLQDTPKKVLTSLQSGLNQVFDDIEYTSSLGMCTFLDPRFKNIGFRDTEAVESIKKELVDLLTGIISKNQTDTSVDQKSNVTESMDEFSIWNSYDMTVSAQKPLQTARSRAECEVQRYLEDELLDRKSDPLVWWREHCYNYPYLTQIVLRQCCTLATSVPCERLSSKAGNLFLEWRTRLKGDKVNQMLTLNVNRQFL